MASGLRHMRDWVAPGSPCLISGLKRTFTSGHHHTASTSNMWHNTYGITHLQLGLELLNLVLESFHSLSTLAACSAQVHGGLTGEGVYGAGPA